MNIAISLLNFDEIVSEFHGSVQKCPNSLRNAEKWKKCEKIRQNSESSVNIFSFRMNNSIQSLVAQLPEHSFRNTDFGTQLAAEGEKRTAVLEALAAEQAAKVSA